MASQLSKQTEESQDKPRRWADYTPEGSENEEIGRVSAGLCMNCRLVFPGVYDLLDGRCRPCYEERYGKTGNKTWKKKTRLAFGFTILNPSQSERKELKKIKAAEAFVETGKRGE